MSKKGFAPLALIIVIGLTLLGGVGGFHYVKNKVLHTFNISLDKNSAISSHQQEINHIIDKMKVNSQIWIQNTNNPEKRKTVHAANVILAQQLEKLLPSSKITYNEQTGFWFKDNNPLYIVSNPNAPKGALSVYSTPSGASIFVDNQYQGITPLQDISLGAGSHVLKLIKTDYKDIILTPFIRKGETTVIKHRLEKKQQSDTASHSFSFYAEKGRKWHLILNGKKFGPYTMNKDWERVWRSMLQFSIDGQHFSLGGYTDKEGKWHFTLDGKSIGTYTNVLKLIIQSR